jgi:hypothetical protein
MPPPSGPDEMQSRGSANCQSSTGIGRVCSSRVVKLGCTVSSSYKVAYAATFVTIDSN